SLALSSSFRQFDSFRMASSASASITSILTAFPLCRTCYYFLKFLQTRRVLDSLAVEWIGVELADSVHIALPRLLAAGLKLPIFWRMATERRFSDCIQAPLHRLRYDLVTLREDGFELTAQTVGVMLRVSFPAFRLRTFPFYNFVRYFLDQREHRALQTITDYITVWALNFITVVHFSDRKSTRL